MSRSELIASFKEVLQKHDQSPGHSYTEQLNDLVNRLRFTERMNYRNLRDLYCQTLKHRNVGDFEDLMCDLDEVGGGVGY